MNKLRRIRDPVHNLISFDGDNQGQTLWQIIQTSEFQRLRRIKQLGFSEAVYPGAAHTRFSHSLGVYHIAKQLLEMIRRLVPDRNNEARSQPALTAALVHDIGHGPFSHAFEEVGKKLHLKMASHEDVSDEIIRHSEISKILDKNFNRGFSENVADLIKSSGVTSQIYGSVVSSQFDADRLDYIQRDRLMAGTQVGSIDFTWLIANLEIGEILWGDESGKQQSTLQTFVLGPKAKYAAEAYILGLFQLYPTVYFHKTTRGIEKLFTELLKRIFELVQSGNYAKTSLPASHPLIQFAKSPDSLTATLALDDTVILGALFQMSGAKDALISEFSARIRERKIYKCIDLRERLCLKFENIEWLEIAQAWACVHLQEWEAHNQKKVPRFLYDEGKRDPYKHFQEEKGPLNQIMIRDYYGEIIDIRDISPVIQGIQPFAFCRIYIDPDDKEAEKAVEQTIRSIGEG